MTMSDVENGTARAMKRRVGELVYSSVQIEGIASTFAQTEEILRVGKSMNVDQESITKILGLKHALEHLFGNYSKPISWELYASYNAFVGEGTVKRAGVMRARTRSESETSSQSPTSASATSPTFSAPPLTPQPVRQRRLPSSSCSCARRSSSWTATRGPHICSRTTISPILTPAQCFS